jgi:hypothetical protein
MLDRENPYRADASLLPPNAVDIIFNRRRYTTIESKWKQDQKTALDLTQPSRKT